MNEYILRQARTPKPCYICYKNSPYVLVSVSVPTLDFFYVCASHVHDQAFATCTRPGPEEPVTLDRSFETGQSDERIKALDPNPSMISLPASATPSQETIPLHAHYALHREFFGRRIRLIQPRRADMPKFPSVPGGAI